MLASPSVGPLSPHDVIAHTYRVDSLLGAGAMGAVYEGFDLQLQRRVAIKAPLIAALAQSVRDEAKALAAVRHPSFAQIYSLVEHEGTPLIVMERVFGEDLATRIERSPQGLPLDEAIDILVGIADALAAAHRAGIVHRDLKPANVILTGDRVVLIDLGLFLPDVLVGPDADAAGSPFWVAPEILLGSSERGQGHLADLYSLGAIAYELVTGRRVYVAELLDQIAAMHVAAPIPDARAHRPDLPAAFSVLIRELLAKDPKDRPNCAEAVVWQLQSLRGRGVARAHAASVLVVDDDPLTASAVRRALAQDYPSLDIRVANDPREALPADDRSPASIVVLDLEMPKTNGLEICMALRGLPPERRPTIIVMSGHASAGDVKVLETLGVERFVPKDEALLSAVGDAIGRARWAA